MPNFVKGDMWSVLDKVDLFLITTNGVIKKRHGEPDKLVMGAGIAAEALQRLPGLDEAIATGIKRAMIAGKVREIPGCVEYSVMINVYAQQINIGVFQTKLHYQDHSQLSVIRRSATALTTWCERNPTKTVALNFPGIGKGKLTRAEVLPLLNLLPESVTLWEKK